MPHDALVIKHRQCETPPVLAKPAKHRGVEIRLWDESRFRADRVPGNTWAKTGQTPVTRAPGQRQGIGAASMVNAKRTGNARQPLPQRELLGLRMAQPLAEIGNHSALVHSFCKHPDVADISDPKYPLDRDTVVLYLPSHLFMVDGR